ncbi:hypothetical protein CO009_03720 [Candidatus Shapirobacteria bacterium CG_4_8_14_3_um_filter_35_11]|uniref:DUF4349 domain-containing protein n=6 Tax=Candidatus Shapironibacteriota TaxID=1752721 RepID=A0A1J5I553_9BACT|nr:MAG: hypothetical protein AUK05_00980 [Candidatus Shapirobacteria bacterium CG2_30_35_20]PIV07714.1 MAG: hypothetical protein COS53_00920 [Candidatus Shapirobacteria bacterium CG03_land_8_20_14_0_80_35_14]PIX68207.1 MAG: hypothetical protein COZ41_00895 [Candidatus Shapirobacteria bacterium CG_4_10_14_3_um_filter_35_13]PJC79718.1 MAG: hypothetical protein CO009_03720 [Candidatus Shapirobacteria bacterium CG_4_8_14_3_um_filter_35_11]
MTNLIKKNWLIILVIIFAIGYVNRKNTEQNTILPMTGGGIVADSVVSDKMLIRREVAPSESTNRLVIQDTSLSLQVDNVESKIKEIESKTTEMGGFLINSNLSKPNGVGSGTISVRIPEGKRDEAMELFKVMAVKVVSENVSGTDVTDQYTDLQAQLEVLQKTKVKFEEILDKAYTVNDLMNVQQQLISLQQQINSVKGQQKYFEQSAKLSKITIYLSTDDLALPYAPTNEWRPAVVFKEAVRSLINNIRGLGNILIWVVVFSPLWIPAIFVIRFAKKKLAI